MNATQRGWLSTALMFGEMDAADGAKLGLSETDLRDCAHSYTQAALDHDNGARPQQFALTAYARVVADLLIEYARSTDNGKD
jgi:hypothetical protein